MSGGPFSPKTTSANQTSVQQTTLNTRNDNISGNSGYTAVASEGSSLTYAPLDLTTISTTDARSTTNTDSRSYVDSSFHLDSDQGAINAGEHLGSQGIAAAVSANATLAAISSDANSLVRGAYHDAADAVIRSTERNSDALQTVAGHALDTVAATSKAGADSAFGFARDTLSQFGKSLADYQLAEQTQLGNTVSALNDSYRQASTSTDERVQQIATSSQDFTREIIKYIAIAAAVAALAFAARRGLPK